MSGDVFRAHTVGQFEGNLFDETASIDEDESGAVICA